MKKRILSILLLCCMVLTLLPTAAFAAGELPDVKLSVPTTFDKTVDLTKQNKELKITDSKTYLIKGSTDPNWYFQYRIKIDGKNNTPHIFLDGVRLQAPKDGPAIELYGGASACLYFIGGDSELIGVENFAALQKNKTDGYLRVLVQTGTKLTCQGGHHGAGIGGSKVGIKKFSQGYGVNLHFGSLATDIYGGEIFATSGVGGAGIGGGMNGGVGEQIYVYSGKLTAISVSQGAGIGGGQGGAGRNIYIKGGTVEAGSRSCGAGIGSGDQDGQNKPEDAHHIEISGGTVVAWSNYAGAGIGGGRNGSGYDISITGGNVKAQGYWGAGIGGGMNGDSGNILIKDTTLTAQSVPLYPDRQYEGDAISGGPAVAVGRGSNRLGWASVLFNPEFGLLHEENVKIGASDGKTVQLSATGWQWRRSQGPHEWDWGTTTELLIPNEYGRVDLQRLSLPYACNYGRVIGRLELHCEKRTCSHELNWTDRDGCHIWACVKCGARDPAAENSKQNAKHIPGDWGNQKQLCTVCGHVMGTDTKAPVLEVLKDGESYTVEDTLDGKPGAYTFTVSDPAASGETSSGIKSVTINGEPQDGPTYRLPAPDGGNNDAGAKYTVVATDNAGNETTATVRTYRWHHVKVISPDGNGTASASPAKAVAGAEITLSATPDKGYHFNEWQVISGGVTITDNKFLMPNDNVEVKAIFEEDVPAPAEFIVTFDGNGGTPSVGSMTTTDRKLTSLPSASRGGSYSFDGWYTEKSGGTKITTDTVFSANTTVYAHWTYIGGGSSGYSYYTIKATAGPGGSISPSGNVSVREGRDQTFTITPDKGYAVFNVKIDDRSIGAVKSYTFENVKRAHTIEVSFTRANEFIDVPAGSYYYDAVLWAVENGITTGASASRFDPNGICTRAQAVTFLWRAAGSPKPETRTMPFADVPAGSYYYDAVLWAVENGITKGTSDTTFSPNMTCTRAQIVAFLWRSEKSPAAGTANPFADVKSTAYYADAVLWAVKENITKGTTNTTFSPDADCTRAQIVTFLWRCKK